MRTIEVSDEVYSALRDFLPLSQGYKLIPVSDRVYSWLAEHKDYLESEGQQHITFDRVIRDLYEKFRLVVEELDRERTHDQ